MSDSKSMSRERFGQYAAGYVTNQTHAKGSELDSLLEIAQPLGQRADLVPQASEGQAGRDFGAGSRLTAEPGEIAGDLIAVAAGDEVLELGLGRPHAVEHWWSDLEPAEGAEPRRQPVDGETPGGVRDPVVASPQPRVIRFDQQQSPAR